MNGFFLSFLAISSLLTMALFKGMDTSMAIVGIVGAYMARRGAEGVASVTAAGKDPNCNTIEAIERIKKG